MTKILIEIDPELQRVVPIEPTDEMVFAQKLARIEGESTWYAAITAAPQPEQVDVEPVAWLSRESESDRICLDVEDSGESGTWSPSFPVYELPPTAEQIEQETAEAIAAMLHSNANKCYLTSDAFVLKANASLIIDGAWKKYK